MKFILLIFLLPCVLASPENSGLSGELIMEKFLSLIEYGVNNLKSIEHVPSSDHEPKAGILQQLQGAIQNYLLSLDEFPIPPINLTNLLYVENATILGIDSSDFTLLSPSGYNVENLTLYIPLLTVTSDKYILNQLNITLLVLDGEGPLRITLEGLKVHLKMNMKFVLQPGGGFGFTVKTLEAADLGLKNATFALTNLGNSGEDLSNLLNGIATAVAPSLVISVSEGLRLILEEANYDCQNGLDILCALVGYVLNTLKSKLIP